MQMTIVDIVNELERLLPQLSEFIDHFNSTAQHYDVVPVTDGEGNMSMDVPAKMTESQEKEVRNKLTIIDRLITTQGQKIGDLLERGIGLENQIKTLDPNHESYLTEKIAHFKRLNESYKH
jgi:hypothetical protein